MGTILQDLTIIDNEITALSGCCSGNTLAIAAIDADIVALSGCCSTNSSAISTLQTNEVFTTKIVLNATQILNLNSLPVQILGAPGAGLINQIVSIYAFFSHAGAVFALNGNTNLVVSYDTISTFFITPALLVTGSSSKFNVFEQSVGSGPYVMAVANTPLNLYVDTANFTVGGGTTSTLTLYITYKTISV